jgi:hypothetical protein
MEVDGAMLKCRADGYEKSATAESVAKRTVH